MFGSAEGVLPCLFPRYACADLKTSRWRSAQGSRQFSLSQLDYHERYQASSHEHGPAVVDWISNAGQVTSSSAPLAS